MARDCLETGEWTGEAPTCSYVDCGVPAPLENGKIELKVILKIIFFVYQKALIGTFYTIFYDKITFINSQHENTNLNGVFAPKKKFETFVWKISGIQK